MKLKSRQLRRIIRSIILETGIPMDPSKDPRDVYTDEEWDNFGTATEKETNNTLTVQPQLRISGDLLDLAVNTYFDFVGRHQVPEDTWSKINEFEQSFPKLGKVLRARLENRL